MAKCQKQLLIISQVVGIGKSCDQNGERVSKNNKSCFICNIWLKTLLEKYVTLSINHNFLFYSIKIVHGLPLESLYLASFPRTSIPWFRETKIIGVSYQLL